MKHEALDRLQLVKMLQQNKEPTSLQFWCQSSGYLIILKIHLVKVELIVDISEVCLYKTGLWNSTLQMIGTPWKAVFRDRQRWSQVLWVFYVLNHQSTSPRLPNRGCTVPGMCPSANHANPNISPLAPQSPCVFFFCFSSLSNVSSGSFFSHNPQMPRNLNTRCTDCPENLCNPPQVAAASPPAALPACIHQLQAFGLILFVGLRHPIVEINFILLFRIKIKKALKLYGEAMWRS